MKKKKRKRKREKKRGRKRKKREREREKGGRVGGEGERREDTDAEISEIADESEVCTGR